MNFTDPVVGEEFFDRLDIICKLNKKLDCLGSGFRQNTALLGPPLSGKTSLLKHFLTNADNKKFLFFYLEVKGNSLKEFIMKFLNSFLSSILSNTDEFNKLYPLDNEILLNKFKSYLPKTQGVVRELLRLLEASDFDNAYERLFGVLECAKSEINRPMVIILEEFQRLSSFSVKSPFEILGKKISLQKDIMYIISSYSVNDAKKIISEKLSFLFCNFEIIELEPFDYPTSRDYIDKKCEGLALENSYKNFIISLTEGKPFYLNTICLKLIELTKMYGSSITHNELIIKTLEDLIFNSNGILNQYLSNMLYKLREEKNFELYFQIFLHLSNGNKSTTLATLMKRSQTEINRLLKVLVQNDFLTKFGVFYKFNQRLFKHWISSVYAVKESPYKNFYMDGKDFFAYKSAHMLNNFICENEKSALDRIMELFKLFDDDMIELSGQRFILPRFDMIYPTQVDEKGYRIVANLKARNWLFFLAEDVLSEERFVQWIAREKDTSKNFNKRVLITLQEPEVATKLLAKQQRIASWGITQLNLLLELYDKPQLIRI